jgi:hypothetical protein
MERFEHAAGDGQQIVLYVSDDLGVGLEPDALVGEIAIDAAELAGRGLEIVSMATMPLRQMGTAGNIFFQSGGQYATKAAIVVVYRRVVATA